MIVCLALAVLAFGAFNDAAGQTAPPPIVTSWGVEGHGDGGYWNGCWGITMGPNGLVYTCDEGNKRIQVFTKNGDFVSKWGQPGGGPGQFGSPRGIVVGPNDLVYVVDQTNDRVQVFTLDGVYQFEWGTLGVAPGEFDSPAGIAISDAGSVFVTDVDNNRVQKFDLDGAYVLEWGSFGTGAGQFQSPALPDVVGPLLFVPDFLSGRVQAFDMDGNYQFEWTVPESNGTQSAQCVKSDPNGDLFIAMAFNVGKFTQSGVPIYSWDPWADGMCNPHDVVVDSDGFIYVAQHQQGCETAVIYKYGYEPTAARRASWARTKGAFRQERPGRTPPR